MTALPVGRTEDEWRLRERVKYVVRNLGWADCVALDVEFAIVHAPGGDCVSREAQTPQTYLDLVGDDWTLCRQCFGAEGTTRQLDKSEGVGIYAPERDAPDFEDAPSLGTFTRSEGVTASDD